MTHPKLNVTTAQPYARLLGYDAISVLVIMIKDVYIAFHAGAETKVSGAEAHLYKAYLYLAIYCSSPCWSACNHEPFTTVSHHAEDRLKEPMS